MNLPSQLAGIAEKWQQQEPQKRKRVIIVAVVSFLALSGLLYIAFRPNYITVFHGLTLEDAAEITSELENKRIPTKLVNAGTGIAVPRKQADEARLEAAAAGLPRSGRVGYDLFNKSSFSLTESERALQQQLLLEEQLAQTLMKINGIQDAEVKLALPKENVFLDPKRQTEATASIWVKADMALDSSQVAGLVHLVSRAVPNLKPDNVTVIDAEGRVLNSSEPSAGVSFSEQQARQQALQLELERSLNTLLGQVFGEENVAVRVAAQLDFNQRNTQTVRWQTPQEGEEGLVRHIEEMSDYYSGKAASGKEPGVKPNSGDLDYPSPDDNDTESVAEKRQRTISYELDEIRETITYAPGAIERLSVSVIVNQPEVSFDAEKVREAVQAAVGYDAERDDIVSVQTMTFAAEDDEVVPVSSPWYSSLPFKIGLGIVFGLLALVVGRARARRRQVWLEETQPAPVAATAEPVEELKMPEDDDAQRMRKHLERIARQKPEEFALLIRAWLNEEN